MALRIFVYLYGATLLFIWLWPDGPTLSSPGRFDFALNDVAEVPRSSYPGSVIAQLGGGLRTG